jgi:hypothetical protein
MDVEPYDLGTAIWEFPGLIFVHYEFGTNKPFAQQCTKKGNIRKVKIEIK